MFIRFCLIWHNLWNYLGDYETFVLQITLFINRLPNLTKPMSYACMFLEMEIFFRIVYYFLVPLLFFMNEVCNKIFEQNTLHVVDIFSSHVFDISFVILCPITKFGRIIYYWYINCVEIVNLNVQKIQYRPLYYIIQ